MFGYGVLIPQCLPKLADAGICKTGNRRELKSYHNLIHGRVAVVSQMSWSIRHRGHAELLTHLG
jgi:hypothetical protein